jgi:drug/metabolite transporter (DMT)-like permease
VPSLFAGLVSTGVGYTLQVVGMKHARASVGAMIMSLEAVFGALGGVLFLGERLTVHVAWGVRALMLAGILVAQLPSRRERAREEAASLAGESLPPLPEPPSTALRP